MLGFAPLMRRFGAVVAVFLISGPVVADWLDCSYITFRSSWQSECNEVLVKVMDERVARAYQAELAGLMDDLPQTAAARQRQQAWFKHRNACTDAACLETAFETRLSELPPAPPPPGEAAIPRFDIGYGPGWTVCESYVRFLNSFPENDPPPMCELPTFGELKEPDWEVLDLQTHIQLVFELEKRTFPSSHERPVADFTQWRKVFEDDINRGNAAPRLRRVRLKLTPDDELKTILAYEPDQNGCNRRTQKGGGSYTNSKLFVWDEQAQGIDEENSRHLPLMGGRLLTFFGRPLAFSKKLGSVMYTKIPGDPP